MSRFKCLRLAVSILVPQPESEEHDWGQQRERHGRSSQTVPQSTVTKVQEIKLPKVGSSASQGERVRNV